MKQKTAKRSNRANRLLGKLAAEKKRSVLALGLITVMVIMWIRVLSGDKPDSAQATIPQDESQNEPTAKVSIQFIELPKVVGRNDVIARDFFASNGWRSFGKDTEGQNQSNTQEIDVVSTDGYEEVVALVTEKLKLEAIVLGEHPQALINYGLVSVGDKLLVTDGVDAHECEVLAISEDTVLIEVGKVRMTLRMPTDVTE
jgi:hypothetical protein